MTTEIFMRPSEGSRWLVTWPEIFEHCALDIETPEGCFRLYQAIDRLSVVLLSLVVVDKNKMDRLTKNCCRVNFATSDETFEYELMP